MATYAGAVAPTGRRFQDSALVDWITTRIPSTAKGPLRPEVTTATTSKTRHARAGLGAAMTSHALREARTHGYSVAVLSH